MLQLPSIIHVGIVTANQAGTIEVDLRDSTKGNPNYKGKASGVVLVEDLDAADYRDQLREALVSTSATFNGVELKSGEVHLTETSVHGKVSYGKPNPKAGQVIAGTGNQWAINHSLVTEIGGQAFLLQVLFIEKPWVATPEIPKPTGPVEVRVNAMVRKAATASARLSGFVQLARS